MLNPSQPAARSKVPEMTHPKLCPGMGRGRPSRLYLFNRGPRARAPIKPATPPAIWMTEEPAKSTNPWPKPRFWPSCASQPPPQTQLPNKAMGNAALQNPQGMALENRQRSAMTPAGIITASITTAAWKKKRHSAWGSPPRPLRKNPRRPIRPKECPKILNDHSPSGAVAPPERRAKPNAQKPRTLRAERIRFVLMICAAFLARHRPMESRLNPAGMSRTSPPARMTVARLSGIVLVIG